MQRSQYHLEIYPTLYAARIQVRCWLRADGRRRSLFSGHCIGLDPDFYPLFSDAGSRYIASHQAIHLAVGEGDVLSNDDCDFFRWTGNELATDSDQNGPDYPLTGPVTTLDAAKRRQTTADTLAE